MKELRTPFLQNTLGPLLLKVIHSIHSSQSYCLGIPGI